MERKFLEHSLLRSESSRCTKVPWNESSWTFRYPGANVPRNESPTGAKVLSVYFLLPATNVQRNEKARYQTTDVNIVNIDYAMNKYGKLNRPNQHSVI